MGLVAGLGAMGLGSAMSGNQGWSESNGIGFGMGGSEGWTDGASSSNGYNVSDSWSNTRSDAYSSGEGQAGSWNYGEQGGYNTSQNSSYNAVYGSEASAKDVERALEANIMQEYFMNRQMEFNRTEAEKARAYETLMSNTAYQRAIADLRKAGLNPILAVNNMGASTPVGAVASSGMANAYKANTYADTRGSSQGSSYGTNYGYNKGESYSWNKSSSESHSRGSSGSHSEGRSTSSSYNKGGSKSTNWNYEHSKSKSEQSNNLAKALNGLGDFFNGITSGIKSGQGWDGYDNPTVMN